MLASAYIQESIEKLNLNMIHYIQYYSNKNFRFLSFPFLFGLLSAVKIIINGEIYAGELMAILFFCFKFIRAKLTIYEIRFLFLALLWAIFQLLSDIINGTDSLNTVKGVFTPIVFAICTVGLITYFRAKLERMPSFLLGATIGGLLSVLFFPDLYAQGNPWKWGIGSGIIGLLSIYSSFFQRANKKIFISASVLMFFLISIYFDSRSLGIIPLFALFLYLMVDTGKYTWLSKLFGTKWGELRIVILILPIVILANYFLSSLFSTDSVLKYLPVDSADKYMKQSSGTYGMLLGGRSEILISFRAFLDQPFFGHGSWARDKSGVYIGEYIYIVSKLGYSDGAGADTLYNSNLIPAHSYLMSALVWSGLFGGAFWIYLISILIKSFFKFIDMFPYFYYYGIFLFFWNIFFSPFGASARWSSAVFLSSYLAFLFQLPHTCKNKI